MAMKSINPATGELIKSFDELELDDVIKQIEKSNEAFLSWREVNYSERSKLMLNAAGVLKNKKDHYATLMTSEMGKPIKQAIAEAEKCAWVCEYYANNIAEIFKERKVDDRCIRKLCTFEPIGVVWQ